MKGSKKVAISVCTYQRPNQLRKAIQAIQRLKIPDDLRPVFHLIDNYPTKEVKDVFCEETKEISFQSHYFPEKNRGLVYARNRALNEAKEHQCDLLAFFDDDDCPDQNWLVNLWSCMKDYSATVVSGKMVFRWPEATILDDDIKRVHAEALEHVHSGAIMKTCGSGNTLSDLHFIEENRVQFNDIFNLTGGEDSHFFELLNKKGAKIVRCNEAVIYSDILTERATEEYIWSRRYNIGYVGYKKDVLIMGRTNANRKVFKKIFKNFWKLATTCFTQSPQLKVKRKQRIVEMRGMIDAFRGVKYEGYSISDGH